MKKRYLIIILIGTITLEVILAIVFLNHMSTFKYDTVKINKIVHSIEDNYGNTNMYINDYNYSIIDNNESLIYSNYENPNITLNEAIKDGDLIIDLNINSDTYKLLIKSSFNETLNTYKTMFIVSLVSISIVQLISFIMYFIYLHLSIIKPFDDMKSFASRVASGNLDIPLKMDRGMNFGAFTESFDIMRNELKKAKIREMEAEKSKRELVARLSHDIKTPVASIKSISEVGLLKSNDSKDRFDTIIKKSDQINTLINNLFTITIEELEELTIDPISIPSYVVTELIKNSDYLNKGNKFNTPECNIYADRLRLQQVFDNVFMNSYKYANTNIEININIDNEYLLISIKDFGNTIEDNEIPLLMEKYKRGNNIKDKEGSGLGLYISKRFIEQMNGKIEIKNDKPGFNVLLYLRII